MNQVKKFENDQRTERNKVPVYKYGINVISSFLLEKISQC